MYEKDDGKKCNEKNPYFFHCSLSIILIFLDNQGTTSEEVQVILVDGMCGSGAKSMNGKVLHFFS